MDLPGQTMQYTLYSRQQVPRKARVYFGRKKARKSNRSASGPALGRALHAQARAAAGGDREPAEAAHPQARGAGREGPGLAAVVALERVVSVSLQGMACTDVSQVVCQWRRSL